MEWVDLQRLQDAPHPAPLHTLFLYLSLAPAIGMTHSCLTCLWYALQLVAASCNASSQLMLCAPSLMHVQVTEQARDNLKFLATLERHFEVLAGGSLAAITDCLPALMGALRMVWIISRYYGDDETMGSLFRRIANQIGDRIEAAIKPEVRVLWKSEMEVETAREEFTPVWT